MKLYYIWDAYCGWCYGFKEALKLFVNNHSELEMEIISGGLFDQGNPISAYPHIPGANQQIAKLFNVDFGPGYEKVLADGSLVMSSYHAAAGFGTLKDNLPKQKWLQAADLLQNAFYQEGQSLSAPETYEKIAEQLQIAGPAFSQKLQ